jgi:hypothetical protein
MKKHITSCALALSLASFLAVAPAHADEGTFSRWWNATKDLTSESYEKTKKATVELYEDGKEVVIDTYEDGKEMTQKGYEKSSKFIKEKYQNLKKEQTKENAADAEPVIEDHSRPASSET